MERRIFEAFCLAIFLSIVFSIASYANDGNVILVRTFRVTEDVPNPQYDPNGNRLPSKPVMVVITNEGVDIPYVSKIDVISYDIIIDESNQVLTFYDDKCFASVLLSMNETVEVRINFVEYSLHGWVHL